MRQANYLALGSIIRLRMPHDHLESMAPYINDMSLTYGDVGMVIDYDQKTKIKIKNVTPAASSWHGKPMTGNVMYHCFMHGMHVVLFDTEIEVICEPNE